MTILISSDRDSNPCPNRAGHLISPGILIT
jgi:hypothetical protein